MQLTSYLRERRWATVFGYLLFVALMVAGYDYNLTFVQLGLIDLGTVVGVGLFFAQIDRFLLRSSLRFFRRGRLGEALNAPTHRPILWAK